MKEEIDRKYLEKRCKEEGTIVALRKFPPPPEADEPLAQGADQPLAEKRKKK